MCLMCSNKTAKSLITNRQNIIWKTALILQIKIYSFPHPPKKMLKEKKSQTPVGFLLWVITITKDYVKKQ